MAFWEAGLERTKKMEQFDSYFNGDILGIEFGNSCAGVIEKNGLANGRIRGAIVVRTNITGLWSGYFEWVGKGHPILCIFEDGFVILENNKISFSIRIETQNDSKVTSFLLETLI